MARPEDRYENLSVITLPDGRMVYKSSRPRAVLVDEDVDVSLTTNEMDRMDVLANNIYGSAAEWWRIAAANRHVNGSLFIRPNTTLIIPRKTGI